MDQEQRVRLFLEGLGYLSRVFDIYISIDEDKAAQLIDFHGNIIQNKFFFVPNRDKGESEDIEITLT